MTTSEFNNNKDNNNAGSGPNSSSSSKSNYNCNKATDFPPLTPNADQTSDSESLVTVLTLCISMIVDVLKESVASDQPFKEADARSLAQTCVDAFATRKRKPEYPYKIAAERQSPAIRWASHDATHRAQENDLR